MDEAYAIILLGDKLKDSNSFIRTKKRNASELPLRGISIPFFPGGLILRLGLAISLYPAICICSKILHLPIQRE